MSELWNAIASGKVTASGSGHTVTGEYATTEGKGVFYVFTVKDKDGAVVYKGDSVNMVVTYLTDEE